ncbi:hypothetical protein [Acidiphilium cryptum]|nr:hypothetical protein [Acidiphilium cryptum]
MASAVPLASPASRFAAIIAALCDRVAAEGHRRGIAGPLVVLIWTRLRRLADRLAAALDGPQRPPRPRHPATARQPAPARPRPLPRRLGWLGTLIPGAAAAAGQLRDLLADPEIAALAASIPAAGAAPPQNPRSSSRSGSRYRARSRRPAATVRRATGFGRGPAARRAMRAFSPRKPAPPKRRLTRAASPRHFRYVVKTRYG